MENAKEGVGANIERSVGEKRSFEGIEEWIEGVEGGE
jgi:hypothetical protein